MKALVIQEGKKVKKKNPLLKLLASITILSGVFPIIIIDLFCIIYQEIYFTIQGIPKINRGQYLNWDRWDLKKLTPAQKFSCLYCAYANGIAAWTKAVVNQTEAYSCAIKHKYQIPGREHQAQFAKYEEYL